MTVAIDLASLRLSEEEGQWIGELRNKIVHFAAKNRTKYALYEGTFVADQIGIAVPPMLRDWPVRVGLGRTVIDVRAERLGWITWETADSDLMDLDVIARTNRLDLESAQVHLGALITGTSFAVVGKDDTGPVIVPRSPSVMAVKKHPLTGQFVAALLQIRNEFGSTIAETLYLENETVTLERKGRKLKVTNRAKHGLGEVPVVQFFNQPNDSHPNGQSVITPPIEYNIGAAARTALAMEVHREFFAAPQRAALGADPEVFGFRDDMTKEEKYALGWALTMGRMNVVPRGDGDGPLPQMHEFKPSSPAVYIEILRYLALQVASDSGTPPSYFGVLTDNPASSDSIKALAERLERRTLSQHSEFDRGWTKVARLSLLRRDGEVDEDKLSKVRSKWTAATTSTPSAQADLGMKLVAADILPADSPVAHEMVGLTEMQSKKVQAWNDRKAARSLMENIKNAAAKVTDPNLIEMAGRNRPSQETLDALAE